MEYPAWQATEDNSLRHIGPLITISTVLLATLSGNPAVAQTENIASRAPAIGGYSPVSYFTKNIAERGSRKFAVEHRGSIYYLASAAQVEVFKQNPDKYRPRHKSCPYSLAFGRVTPLDPTNFKIVGDNLLLFHLSADEDGLQLWNDSDIDEAELLRRADANVFLMKF
ncbi:MAG: hypothetical protein E2O52_01835 [Gammaproteobacteria bacterium]|nr:MAG: hypothetical protein E2O52_01835 [Gammaproteobacteria bacterium]